VSRFISELSASVLHRFRRNGMRLSKEEMSWETLLHTPETYAIWAGEMKINLRKS